MIRSWRVVSLVTYANATIPVGTIIDEVDPDTVHGFARAGILKQLKHANKEPGPDDPPASPVLVLHWNGQYRTCPLRYLERV